MIGRFTRKSRVAARNGRPFAANPLLAESLPRWRSSVVQCVLLCAFLGLAGRAVWLQVWSGEFLQKQGAYRYARTLDLPGTRGRIVDRAGHTLATSVPAVTVWAIPEDLREAEPDTLRRLAGVLQLQEVEIAKRIATAKNFVYLKNQVDPAVARQLGAIKIRGIGFTDGFRRVYPQGNMASHVVGFVGREGRGLEGIELAHQTRLEGASGHRRVIKDRLGNIVEDVGTDLRPQPGKDSVLSISSVVQYVASKQLKEAVEKFQAKAGGAIVVDAHTGEILALANYPSYDPNDAGALKGPALRNRAITDIYEPGSVLKPFTVALAIDRGKVSADTMIDTGPGRYVINGAPISDTSAHGIISVSDVLRYSSNIGTAKLALGLPAKDMWEMFTSLGFGQQPQLGFPGAAAGRVRPYRSWRPIEQATMSYGNGIAVSLLQLARAYTIFTNDGKVVPLTLEKSTGTPAGTRVISPATARTMREMLENVVVQGTAKNGRIPGYRVGGKTGTAYKAENGRYVFPRKYIASFVGIVPMSAPRFIVAVMIDEPSGRYHYGGQVAAPAFVNIASNVLQVTNVAPDAATEDVLAAPETSPDEIED
ncbi:peptidoglycan D,D-transpeptidase FtsI family protein [Massilia sp. 2TAF26]|uniref:peptidoglycan D,D-transpeptidase FtsI family protein n=1 Tax=Massilia sp. 2TAF26 TaxID=3233012 RepID=UPI003F97700A